MGGRGTVRIRATVRGGSRRPDRPDRPGAAPRSCRARRNKAGRSRANRRWPRTPAIGSRHGPDGTHTLRISPASSRCPGSTRRGPWSGISRRRIGHGRCRRIPGGNRRGTPRRSGSRTRTAAGGDAAAPVTTPTVRLVATYRRVRSVLDGALESATPRERCVRRPYAEPPLVGDAMEPLRRRLRPVGDDGVEHPRATRGNGQEHRPRDGPRIADRIADRREFRRRVRTDGRVDREWWPASANSRARTNRSAGVLKLLTERMGPPPHSAGTPRGDIRSRVERTIA